MAALLYVLVNFSQSQAQTGNQLTVRLYNSAYFSPGDLVQAEERAAGIFRDAKIKINWEVVQRVGNVGEQKQREEWNHPADLHLRLWTHSMLGPNSFSYDTLGFCLSMEQSTAIIIADEIRSRAAVDFSNPGDLLGVVMAHEMGHLLLRSPTHSVEGIMQARLSTDLRDRKRLLLAFSPQQATFIRVEIRRRTDVQRAVLHP